MSWPFKRQDQWIDEALLHDGRTVEVERTVTWNSGALELSQAFKSWPNQFTLRATNPDTGKVVRWAGEPDFRPLVLDFLEKTAHLVVGADAVDANLKQYGCPDIPYIFFRYDERRGRWTQISAQEFPRSLLNANLSPSYDSARMADGKRVSKEDIAHLYRAHTTRVIPTDFASWQYPYKNQYRVGRYRDGCRDTVPSNQDPSHPQSPGQPSRTTILEILEIRNYDPEWVLRADDPAHDWNAMSWDKERDARCRAFVKRVGDNSDTPELRGWLLFVNDPSGRKKARQSGQMFCEADALWFVDYVVEPRSAVLSKFTTAGDFIYRLSFEKPNEPGGYLGGILHPTFQAKDGFLFFEWWNTNQAGRDRHVKRWMKCRVREPMRD